ncbi:hypothetical protein KKH27_13705 [bacterium]|nr:hypothetical protein [bacterium]MBU1983499.1 hypothetical protein [bacterium]
MSLFDRYGRLRKEIREGRILTGPKEILPHLSGRLSKADLPELLVEPLHIDEVRAALEFAAERKMKVAVTSGLKPAEVRNLESCMLILTNGLAASPVFSDRHRTVRADAGLPMESLSVDLTQTNHRWAPLLPVPAKTSLGEMFALGWEGLRNWQDGGALTHVGAVEWMAYDGNTYRTGPAGSSENEPDVSGFLFGSRGRMGIITALELALQPKPPQRTALLLQLPDALTAVTILSELRAFDPLPETVVYWGEVATQLLREGTDNRVSSKAAALLTVEWAEELPTLPDAWTDFGRLLGDDSAIQSLWEDLFRFPRITARLYPQRTGIRLKMLALGLADLEEAARDLGHEFNLPVALWGTVEAGHLQVWVLQPDGESRTIQHAETLLGKLYEIAVGLEGTCAPGTVLPFDSRLIEPPTDDSPLIAIRQRIIEKCDPHGLYVPLTGPA